MKRLATYVAAFAFIASGAGHFVNAAFYRPMMPPWLPWHDALIYLSGAFEIAGGFGVLIPPLRRIAGWEIIGVLIAVFPANIHMALEGISPPGLSMSPLALWARLPLQGVFIAWVYWVAVARDPSAP